MRLFNTLNARLAVALIAIFLLVGAFSANILLKVSSGHQELVAQQIHKDLAKYVVKDHLLFNDAGLDLSAAKMTFMNLMVLGPNFEFYVVDPDGKILAYSAKPGLVKRKTVSLDAIKAFVRKPDRDEVIVGDNPRAHGEQKIFSAAPIVKSGQTIGYLYVILVSDIHDSVSDALKDSKTLRSGVLVVLASLVFALLASLLLVALITKPLCILTRQVIAVREEGFKRAATDVELLSATIEYSSSSAQEIQVLGSSFKDLIERLAEQYQQAVTIDELRKELLTHVSHDLRTPLASLLGYLETWKISHGEVSEEESNRYIEVATRNAKTIANLIEQLFELAHLDSGSVKVHRESFSMIELAGDVIQKFTIEAAAKKIGLAVEPKGTNYQVLGDIEKLERVMTNLVENALRHTREGGSITVRFSQSGQFVGVDVVDTGIGIPEQDVPHIFDAHFKAQNSIRGNAAHGGIGLAIVKKIVDLHQGSISVTSQVDQGTTFSLTLPAS